MDNSKSIIIFDDDQDILFICASVLKKIGWTVHTFTDCRQVEEKVSNIMPAVIIMDNWIPDGGGINATQQLKRNSQLKKIPVIFFTANMDIAALAATAGADFYLSKPFEVRDLENLVNAVGKGI